MSDLLFVGIGGSMRERSYSRAGLSEVLNIAADTGAQTQLFDVRSLQLPVYEPGITLADLPDSVRDRVEIFLETCRKADAFVWSSPGYHSTISGAVKNALDYLEYLADDQPPYLTGKPVGLIGQAGALAAAGALEALYHTARALRMWVAPTQLITDRTLFTDDMRLREGRTLLRFQRMVGELLDFAELRRAKFK